MAIKICESCSAQFTVQNYRAQTARFCSGSCRAKWVATLPHSCVQKKDRAYMVGNKFRQGLKPANAFSDGHKPWNKDLKGIRLSPATEFAPGHAGTRRLPVGSETVRRIHDGHLRVFTKVAEPNHWKLRARFVWEQINGPIPRGSVIHHRDRDTMNDATDNLRCLTRAEHIREHAQDLAR